MYLVAQRVVSGNTGLEGINAFHYAHGLKDWALPPDPDDDPGDLIRAIAPIPAGGNRVRSYLDVVAPDAALWAEIRQALSVFVLDHFDSPMPWVAAIGRIRFRLAMDRQLAQSWKVELTSLFRAVEAVR